MGLLAGAGRSKDEVNYRQYEKCLTCTHFYNPGSCELVQGNISPDGLCDLWEIRPRKNIGKDASFYKEQYAKNPTAFADNLPGGGR